MHYTNKRNSCLYVRQADSTYKQSDGAFYYLLGLNPGKYWLYYDLRT